MDVPTRIMNGQRPGQEEANRDTPSRRVQAKSPQDVPTKRIRLSSPYDDRLETPDARFHNVEFHHSEPLLKSKRTLAACDACRRRKTKV